MKTDTVPPLRVSTRLRREAESVLREGETLSAFMLASLTRGIESRKAETAFIERGTVEVAPLAFMRGRTLNDSFIILDEAQNTTEEQMKMFLTRLGYGSKAVVTGDVTQVDLPTNRGSGLVEVQKVLRGVEGVGFCHFSEVDVVRHPLVQEVVRAYEQYDVERKARAEGARGTPGSGPEAG